MLKYISLIIITILLLARGVLIAETDMLQIPSSVNWMYVFLQDPNTMARGSSKEVATMITPSEFRKNITRYQDIARRDKSKLIVTAETEDGHWVQTQISYKGRTLRAMRYYHQGIDRVVPGAEIPLD